MTRHKRPRASTAYTTADLPPDSARDEPRLPAGAVQRQAPDGQLIVRVGPPLVPDGITLEMPTTPLRAGVTLTELLRTAKEIKVNSILRHYINALED